MLVSPLSSIASIKRPVDENAISVSDVRDSCYVWSKVVGILVRSGLPQCHRPQTTSDAMLHARISVQSASLSSLFFNSSSSLQTLNMYFQDLRAFSIFFESALFYRRPTVCCWHTVTYVSHFPRILSRPAQDPTNPRFAVRCESNPALHNRCTCLWLGQWRRASLRLVPKWGPRCIVKLRRTTTCMKRYF